MRNIPPEETDYELSIVESTIILSSLSLLIFLLLLPFIA